MNNYKMKPKYTCGDSRSNAKCVFYDLDIPEFSNIYEEECLTVEETTEDLYKIVEWLKESVDLKELEQDCFETEKVQDTYFKNTNRFLVRDVIKELRDDICELKQGSDEEDDTLSLDFKCLMAPCGTPIASLKDLLQTLIDEVCTLKGE